MGVLGPGSGTCSRGRGAAQAARGDHLGAFPALPARGSVGTDLGYPTSQRLCTAASGLPLQRRGSQIPLIG